jgi:transposase InsO family protein
MSHANAKLNEYGRLLLVSRLEEGWTQAEVAEAQGVSRSTVSKWWRRYREEGIAGLKDRSSAPRRQPHALGETVVEAICSLRRELGAGPHRIAYELGMAASTVYGVLRRQGIAVLARLDRTTRSIIRYERDHPGELVHLDVKKFGRVPDGGGKRFDEGFAENGAGRKRPGRKRGHDFVHVAVDDHSRYAYAEALPDEKGPTTAAFLMRAAVAFASVGITVQRVLTDNGGNYRSFAFQAAASELGISRRYTRPYRPQTNGKAEAFNKTLQREWAYRCPYGTNQERLAALQPFLDDYNFVRPHTAIGNRPPASRLLTT